MKNRLLLILVGLLFCAPAFSKTDTLSEDYLKNRRHFSIMNPFAEHAAQSVIKKSLKKETKGKFKVKFDGYHWNSEVPASGPIRKWYR